MRVAMLAVAMIACGGDDAVVPHDAHIDAPIDTPQIVMDMPVDMLPPGNSGFTTPTAPLAAWTENPPGTFTQQVLDLSCLGQGRTDQATTVTVSLAVTVRDFQSNNLVPSAGVTVFPATNTALVLSSGTSDSTGNVTLTIPSNNKRLGFQITAASARPTFIYDQLLASAQMSQSKTLSSLSNATAATLPALIGQSAMPNTAIVLATVRDCQGHTVSNFVATVSTVPNNVVHAMNATTFYFSDSVALPVHHSQAAMGTRDGLYMVIDVPPLTTGYLQVWGFRDANELASNTLTRIAEFAAPITMNTAMFVEHEPRTTN